MNIDLIKTLEQQNPWLSNHKNPIIQLPHYHERLQYFAAIRTLSSLSPSLVIHIDV